MTHTKSYISTDQHGFYPGRSVTTNLLRFTSGSIRHLEEGKQVDAIYTDLKAAFDKIDHGILLRKLSKLGVIADLVDWLKSYLCDRKLCVKIGSYTSAWFESTSGVPQGSNLGPLLFALYFNDIAALLGVGCRLVYADDLKIYVVVDSSTDCVRLQYLLNMFANWCEVNHMSLSIDKCFVVTFCRSTNPIHWEYKIGDTAIQRNEQVKDLGVLLDTKLSFNDHRSDIIDRANRQLGFIMRTTKEFTDVHCLKTLYTSLVRSILESSSVVWCPYQTTWIERLERIQRRFVRFALRLLPWSDRTNLPPYADRCRLLGIDTLEQRRSIQQEVFVVKIMNEEVDCPSLLAEMSLNAPTHQYHGTDAGLFHSIGRCLDTSSPYPLSRDHSTNLLVCSILG